MIDLHMHSNYSDGTYSVDEIISEAKKLNLTQIAITDHNILDGSILASNNKEIDTIVGTELSVDYKGNEVHLLGYFPSKSNYKNTDFIIKEGHAYKHIAMVEMVENLNKMGFDITINELSKYGQGVINRVHICMAMMDHGYISSIDEGFKKYVGDHCEAYVQRKTVTIKEASNAIRQDGGIAVIAHPYEYLDFVDIDYFLEDIKEYIDGIECFHPSASKDDSFHLVEIAKKENKIITGGSDFHGKNKPAISIDMMKVDDKYKIKK